jgi:hypothetical protein
MNRCGSDEEQYLDIVPATQAIARSPLVLTRLTMARAGANPFHTFSKDPPSPGEVLVTKNFRTKSVELTEDLFQFL